MKVVEIYDPPQSCVLGSCGPDGDDEQNLFAATLESLRQSGAIVSRFNLGLDPQAFAQNPLVKEVIRQEGIAALPLVLVGGTIISKGRYPTTRELGAETSEEVSQPSRRRYAD